MKTLLIALWLGGSLVGTARASEPAAVPTPAPTAVATAAPAAVPTPPPGPAKVTSAEGQQLLKHFDRAQSTYLNALKHRQKVELQELAANQKHRNKEWEGAEREKRLAFFEQNRAGKDRRTYVKDFLERRKMFQQVLKEEMGTRKKDFTTRRKATVAELVEKRKQFRALLKQGLRPDENLWPASSP